MEKALGDDGFLRFPWRRGSMKDGSLGLWGSHEGSGEVILGTPMTGPWGSHEENAWGSHEGHLGMPSLGPWGVP